MNQSVPSILVIEDDKEIQFIIEDALAESGFEPAIAASGEEAVTLLKGLKGAYRALVTDIALAGRINGWEIARQARVIDPAFPVAEVIVRLLTRQRRAALGTRHVFGMGKEGEHHLVNPTRGMC